MILPHQPLQSLPHASLADRLVSAPHVHDPTRAERERTALAAVAAADPSLAPLRVLLGQAPIASLLDGVFSGSPFLTRLIARYPGDLQRCLCSAPEQLAAMLSGELQAACVVAPNRAQVMHALRRYKSQIALLTALADLGGVWPVLAVTRTLAEAADAAVRAALGHVFAMAQDRGDWLDAGPDPAACSGYFVLAMGKHGAFELNYSSDIDLIVFYDPA